MIKVNVNGGNLEQKEIDAYIDYGKKKYPDKNITQMDVTLDGEYVNLKYTFENIRRITGYLVGTLDRFNNAKRAEERDRVKHGI